MHWHDEQTWKRSIISTMIGLIGCMIGTIGLLYIFAKHSWLYLFLSSFVVGIFCCLVIVSIINISFQKSISKKPITISLTTSTLSLMSIMLMEDLIILLNHSTIHQLVQNTSNLYWNMGIGMIFAYVILVPFNYYLLKKTINPNQKLLR